MVPNWEENIYQKLEKEYLVYVRAHQQINSARLYYKRFRQQNSLPLDRVFNKHNHAGWNTKQN